ncbi:MAG: hypothetical protein WBP16_02525 [Ferruginibacter sp.]
MNKNTKTRLSVILAGILFISFAVVSCNSESKEAEPTPEPTIETPVQPVDTSAVQPKDTADIRPTPGGN